MGDKAMKIYDNGTYREMTAEELAAIEDARKRAEAEERHRPFTFAEVMEKFVRAQINSIAADDATAYRMKDFYPEWKAGHAYTAGERLVYGGELYSVLQAHTSQEAWLPGVGTESIYVRIDEAHDGTKYDPIPYGGNTALEDGRYYVQDGVTYVCTRGTGNAVYQPLAELAGIYVEVVGT
nr:MAG TPA: ChiA1-BD-binding domain protein [Caudoviricetes sp.]